MHQLNTKNIEIHEWGHECIYSKSKTIHVTGIVYLNQKMISKDWLSIKKRQFNQTDEIPEISSWILPGKDPNLDILILLSFMCRAFQMSEDSHFQRGLERQPRSIHEQRFLIVFLLKIADLLPQLAKLLQTYPRPPKVWVPLHSIPSDHSWKEIL